MPTPRKVLVQKAQQVILAKRRLAQRQMAPSQGTLLPFPALTQQTPDGLTVPPGLTPPGLSQDGLVTLSTLASGQTS